MQYLKFGLSITIISWLVGMILNGLLKDRTFYIKCSSLNFVRSTSINKWLGVRVFKWIVKNTVFKYLNEKLRVEKKVGVPELKELRKEMTSSELSHLIGFGFAGAFAAAKVLSGDPLFGLVIMVPNTLLNLHPVLLQQENKRRIDRLLKRYVCSELGPKKS